MDESQILNLAKSQTEEFLTQLGLDGEIKVSFMDADSKEEVPYKYIMIELEGENLSELIGFHGKMLEGLQNILGLFINKLIEGNTYRVMVDVNDYRDRRTEYLTKYTERAAQEVKMNKQPLELPPMKPFERRIVHMILKNDPELETESIGEGEDRRVIIKSK